MQLWFFLTVGPKPPGASLHIGSCFHKSLATNFRQKVKTGKDLKPEDLEGEYELAWGLEREKVDFQDIRESVAKDKGIIYLRNYGKERCPVLYPEVKSGMAVVEYPMNFQAKSGEKQIEITGTADLVTSALVGVDHKTASGKWTQEKASKEIQPYLYYFGLKHQGLDIRSFEFGVSYRTKTESGTQVFPVQYNEQIVKQYVLFAFDIQRMFETESPTPGTKGWWCSKKWCGWWRNCRFGGEQITFSLPGEVEYEL
jgi:hypothetical protein